MRTIVCCLTLLLPTLAAEAQNRVSSTAEYVVGQIVRVSGDADIDLGFVHGFKLGDRLALFRSSDIAWEPVGVVKVTRAASSSSIVTSVGGLRPQRGDLVVVAQSLLPARPASKRDEHFVTQRILDRRMKNHYDTLATSTDTRQLAKQRYYAKRWFRQGADSGIKLTLGVRREAYDSKRVVRLAKQCRYLAELRVENPTVMTSVSDRWTMVLPAIAPVTESQKPKTTDAVGENATEDEEFATTAVPNILPRVEAGFKDEPKAIQEATAIVLAALLAKSPRSYPAFLQSQYLQTQFPRLASDEEFIRQLETFIPQLTGE